MLFLALDIVTIVCNLLFGARVLARHPRNISAQIAALIAFNTICHILLSRQEYGYWIAAPYQFHVGGWAPFLNFARNLTPGLFMVLCFTLFADRQRFPRWLIALFAAMQLTRLWVVAALGDYWTTRVITVDDEPLVRSGPFRFVRHPNYWVVVVEVAVLPLAFGNWPVALIWSALNGLMLRHRIGIENAALAPRAALS